MRLANDWQPESFTIAVKFEFKKCSRETSNFYELKNNFYDL